MVKSLILNSKRAYNHSSIHHSLEKQVKKSLPNSVKYFKYETQVCICQKAPLQVNGWSEISKDNVDEMW